MRLGTQPRQRLTLVVACTAQVMMVLDVMIVSVALPSLQRELALLLAGAILAAAGVVGFLGLRHLQSPASQQRQRTDVSTNK